MNIVNVTTIHIIHKMRVSNLSLRDTSVFKAISLIRYHINTKTLQ